MYFFTLHMRWWRGKEKKEKGRYFKKGKTGDRREEEEAAC